MCSKLLKLCRIPLPWLRQDVPQPTQISLGLVDKVGDGLVVFLLNVARTGVDGYRIADILGGFLEQFDGV